MRLVVLAAATTLAACGSGGAPTADADEGVACVASGRGEMYADGIEHQGMRGMLNFRLTSATPTPPGFSDNTWIIQINALSGGVIGAPATGATLTVTPFMPDHAHGTLRVNVAPMPDAGQYRASSITLWMPGLWEVTIDAQVGAIHDTTVFRFCIQA